MKTATGPKYEVGHLNEKYTVLVRNPNGVLVFYAQTGEDKRAAVNLVELLNKQDEELRGAS
jgi:hypothetical protein